MWENRHFPHDWWNINLKHFPEEHVDQKLKFSCSQTQQIPLAQIYNLGSIKDLGTFDKALLIVKSYKNQVPKTSETIYMVHPCVKIPCSH